MLDNATITNLHSLKLLGFAEGLRLTRVAAGWRYTFAESHAYQAESDLVRLAAPHYARSPQEGRTLLHAAIASPADLSVDDGLLRVTIAPQSSPHRSAAIQALCQELNETNSVFPGTDLRLRFAVAPHPHAS